MKLFTERNIYYLIFLTIAVSLGWYIVLANFAPFGLSDSYVSGKEQRDISELVPRNRISTIKIDGEEVSELSEDLIYFATKMPFQFDTAEVAITYRSFNPEQEIYVGYQDQDTWHYALQLFYSPILENLNWNKIGQDPVLLQQNKRFNTVNDFIENPPKDQIIGLYNFEKETLNDSSIKIPDYKPSKDSTVINYPLRGSHTFYAYLENEPFKMNVEKQDINWYEGEDPVSIRIYKEKDLVYVADITDDGITNASGKSSHSQEVSIQNPGPELPENGVYKIVIDASGDSIIKKITTNLSKIVVADALHLAGNKNVFPHVVSDTQPTTFYTQGSEISATTFHSAGFQEIYSQDVNYKLDNIKKPILIPNNGELNKFVIPQNDVVIESSPGYFAFSELAYFSPTPYLITTIRDQEDINNVDYILTSYNSTTTEESGWTTTVVTFDLKNAIVKDENLSWLIRAPRLKENDGKILIKEIRVKMEKKPMINL